MHAVTLDLGLAAEMDLANRFEVSRAAALALAAAGSIAAACLAPAPARAEHPLQPDLVTLGFSQSDLRLERVGKVGKQRLLLRMTNEVANQGAGPLEILPGTEAETCEGNPNLTVGRLAFQRVFIDADDNGFDRGVDTGSDTSDAGCMQYHPPHFHWHVLDFAEYSLYDERSGELAASGGKAGFCLIDTLVPFPGLPGTPNNPFYTGPGCSSSASTPPSLEGISVGWSDVYSSYTPGQRINVTGLGRGRYCLVSKADPSSLMTETDDSNNSASLRIRLRPRRATVTELPGPCTTPV